MYRPEANQLGLLSIRTIFVLERTHNATQEDVTLYFLQGLPMVIRSEFLSLHVRRFAGEFTTRSGRHLDVADRQRISLPHPCAEAKP